MKFGNLTALHIAVGVIFFVIAMVSYFGVSILVTALEYGTMAGATASVALVMWPESDTLVITNDETPMPAFHYSDATAVAASWVDTERAARPRPRPCDYCGTTKGYGIYDTCLSCGAPKPKRSQT